MTQKQFEIIKAIVWGETNQEIVEATGATKDDVQNVRDNFASEIETAKSELKKAGYLK